jgi:hypothetical protein
LLHKASESGEDFITFPNIWGRKDSDLKMLLLNVEVSLFDENPDITAQGGQVIADGITLGTGATNYKVDTTSVANQIRIDFPTNITFINSGNPSQIKSVIFYQETEADGRATYIAKNVAKLPDADKLQPWYIYPTFNT